MSKIARGSVSKLRWYVVVAATTAVLVVAALAGPALRDALLTDGSPEPGPTPSTGPGNCPVSQKLVPECGSWWGVAPGVFTTTPASTALADFESKTGRHADIYHRYHRGDELFPTRDEIAAAHDPAGPRVLLVNWKVAWGTTWADVAAGGQDERIDRLAEHLKQTFGDKFFLSLHHEPENDVDPDPDSGMTAKDYAAMYRHTVERLRDDGVDNAVFVMIYMGFQRWATQPWFDRLYPGDDVVDWIGYDPYVSADPTADHHGDFARLVNQTSDPDTWPGFYNWSVAHHPDKPLMLSEWGVFEYPDDPARKAEIFDSVEQQLPDYPALKALVYFDSPRAPRGDTRIDSSDDALDAFRTLAALPIFSVLWGPTDPNPSPSPTGSAPASATPTVSPATSASASPNPSGSTPSSPSPTASPVVTSPVPSRPPSPSPSGTASQSASPVHRRS